MAGAVHRPGDWTAPRCRDAAWAAHFGFHSDLPQHALQQGADALVTSAHKTLPAWSQGALILARTQRLDPHRLAAAVDATHTTSPAGAILASIDASRALLEAHGERLLGQTIDLVRSARDRLSRIRGLIVLDGPNIDPLKLTLLLAGTGADGNRIEAGLIARGMPVELAHRDTIVAMASLADDRASLDGLVQALEQLIPRASGPVRAVATVGWVVEPEQACSPRGAFFAPSEAVSFDAARDRICAELIAPYPPGIPVLAPGERITDVALDALARARRSGVRIAYAADATLATLRALRCVCRTPCGPRHRRCASWTSRYSPLLPNRTAIVAGLSGRGCPSSPSGPHPVPRYWLTSTGAPVLRSGRRPPDRA